MIKDHTLSAFYKVGTRTVRIELVEECDLQNPTLDCLLLIRFEPRFVRFKKKFKEVSVAP